MQASVLVADSDGHPVRAALTTNRDDRLAKVAIFPADRQFEVLHEELTSWVARRSTWLRSVAACCACRVGSICSDATSTAKVGLIRSESGVDRYDAPVPIFLYDHATRATLGLRGPDDLAQNYTLTAPPRAQRVPFTTQHIMSGMDAKLRLPTYDVSGIQVCASTAGLVCWRPPARLG